MRQTQQHPIKLSAFDPKENDAINAVGQDQAIEISADISRRAFVLGAGVAALSGLAAPAFVAERKHEVNRVIADTERVYRRRFPTRLRRHHR